MENKQPLLSICIPTYNRAEYLEGALENITSDPAFDDRVEVIISDNASTDDTAKVVHLFCKKYCNVKYYCNDKNIKDKNFIVALQRGRGKYVRLFNDTLRFKKGALENMLHTIKSTPEDKVLFFFQNIDFIKDKNCSVVVHDINSFLSYTSYYITWIANFGCWKRDFETLKNPYIYTNLQLSQVDWFLQLAQHPNIVIHFDLFFNSSIVPKKKGGYNIFKVFVDNYLYILKQHRIGFVYYQIEKYRLFRYFLLSWLIMLSNNDNYTFHNEGIYRILFRHYCVHPYFFLGLLYYSIKRNSYK